MPQAVSLSLPSTTIPVKPPQKMERVGRAKVLNFKTADGAIGGMAQKIGGPLDQDGMVGKQFKADGAIGGTAQSIADRNQ